MILSYPQKCLKNNFFSKHYESLSVRIAYDIYIHVGMGNIMEILTCLGSHFISNLILTMNTQNGELKILRCILMFLFSLILPLHF